MKKENSNEKDVLKKCLCSVRKLIQPSKLFFITIFVVKFKQFSIFFSTYIAQFIIWNFKFSTRFPKRIIPTRSKSQQSVLAISFQSKVLISKQPWNNYSCTHTSTPKTSPTKAPKLKPYHAGSMNSTTSTCLPLSISKVPPTASSECQSESDFADLLPPPSHIAILSGQLKKFLQPNFPPLSDVVVLKLDHFLSKRWLPFHSSFLNTASPEDLKIPRRTPLEQVRCFTKRNK